MTEKLKPCPFCGSEAEFNSDEFGEGVYCKSCGATLRNGVYGEYGRKLASAEWNARPIEDALQKELDEAREDNCENMEYHVAERKRLRKLLKSCCNEFAPRNSNYPVCSRANWCVDAKGHCFERKECPIYAELTKGD